MSFWEVTTPGAALSPRVWAVGRVLYIRTNLLLQALSLFSYVREVAVDPVKREIRIETRRWWLARRARVIPFSRVRYLRYGFESVGTSWGWFPGLAPARHDQLEAFPVSVVLRYPDEVVRLATFRGEGSATTGLLGVLLGDSLVDVRGNQEERSLEVVEVLQRMLGVPLGESFVDRPVHAAVCVQCRRSSAPGRSACLYCGGAIEVSSGP